MIFTYLDDAVKIWLRLWDFIYCNVSGERPHVGPLISFHPCLCKKEARPYPTPKTRAFNTLPIGVNTLLIPAPGESTAITSPQTTKPCPIKQPLSAHPAIKATRAIDASRYRHIPLPSPTPHKSAAGRPAPSNTRPQHPALQNHAQTTRATPSHPETTPKSPRIIAQPIPTAPQNIFLKPKK